MDDISYIRVSESDVKTDRIIKDVPYKIEKVKGRNALPLYHIEKSNLEEVKRMATSQIGKT